MPTIDIPDKICSHCGGTKWYYSSKKPNHKCKKLINEQWNNWRNSNVEHFRKQRRDYYHTKVDKVKYYKRCREAILKDPERSRQYKLKYYTSEKGKNNLKQYRTLNAEKVTQWKKNQKIKSIEILSDNYIKELIIQHTELSFSDIPQPLIELKRKQLLLKRQIKNNDKN